MKFATIIMLLQDMAKLVVSVIPRYHNRDC